MKRMTFILMLAFLLALPIPLYARGSDDLPGRDAPEYTRLLDIKKGMQSYKSEEFLGLLGMAFGEEGADLLKAIEDACGCNNWEQNILRATEYDGNVYIKTVMDYVPVEEDESLSMLLADWKPCSPKIIKGFNRDNILALYDFGNPKGAFDVLMKWFTDTDALENIIESMPGEEEKAFIEIFVKQMQMLAKGYWYDAKDDYYPLIGDEIVLAVYPNEDYVGWDDIWSAESTEEYMMARIILAVQTSKPGLADVITDTAEECIDLFSAMHAFDYSGEDYEKPEVLTTEGDGYAIHYIDIEGAFQIAWCEYGGAMFLSDLDTLQDLPEFFDKALPYKMDVKKFNEYMYLNADGLVDIFYEPATWFFEDMFWSMDAPEDEEFTAKLDEMNTMLLSGELGEIEIVEVISGHTCEINMKAGRVSADLMLEGIDLFKYAGGKSAMEDALMEYFGFYGGSGGGGG